MNISINNGKEHVEVTVPKAITQGILDEYPEMAMLFAMEELAELSQAISKCVRNGSASKKDNLAEEIVDVLTVIQWAIQKFDISLKDIEDWAKKKKERTIEREKNNETIFRSKKARKIYNQHHLSSNDDQVLITKTEDGHYKIRSNVPISNFSDIIDMVHTTDKKSKKLNKKAREEMDNILKSKKKGKKKK